MKTSSSPRLRSLATIAAVAASAVVPVAAWWDNAHMLVGQVASQLMAPDDVAVVNKLLGKWNDDFPSMGTITTAAVWPDQVKCHSDAPYCKLNSTPSFTAMDEWHYIDLPLNANGAKWGGKDASLELFNEALSGNAIDVLEKSLETLKTTKSVWAANLVIRNFIHVFGDLHQPLHTVGAVSEVNPKGDEGGNYYRFKSPCGFKNLHALWDAAGGVYSQNNWNPKLDFLPELEKNATGLVQWLPSITDTINLAPYKDLDYDAFVTKVNKNDKVLRNIILDSYRLAPTVVYGNGIDLQYVDVEKKIIPCPTQAYIDWAAYVAPLRVATAGKRLAVFLTQFAKAIRKQQLV